MGHECIVLHHFSTQSSHFVEKAGVELGGKPTWLPLNFGYHDVMRTANISPARKMEFRSGYVDTL